MFFAGINPDSFNPRVLYIIKRKFSEEGVMSYHTHDFCSLTYILAGSCTYRIDDVSYPVKKGDLIVCNPGVYHGRTLMPKEDITEFHIGLNNLYVEGLPKDHLVCQGVGPVVSLGRYEQDFSRCLSDIMLEQEKDEPGHELMLKALVMRLVVILLKSLYSDENRTRESGVNIEHYDKTNIVNTIVSFINENYMEEISLNRISKNMYLSPVYISKIFKEEMGESPINYLIKVRLAKACELLETGALSVKSAAKTVGYDDAYHFSKLFKKYYGCPPSMYRKGT